MAVNSPYGPNARHQPKPRKKLSPGIIVLIVLGSVVLILLALFVLAMVLLAMASSVLVG